MPSASTLRLQIEHTLASRFPSALTPVPRTVRECAAVGVTEIDRLLGGGFPIGAISEITGPTSSGRTSLALAFVAQRTNAGQVCAWVDVSDALDPESAAASGVNLRRLLWVRCQSEAVQAKDKPRSRLHQAVRVTDLLLNARGFAAIVIDMGDLLPEEGRHITLAAWYRFKHAAYESRTSLMVLGKAASAQATAAVVLECSSRKLDSENRKAWDSHIFDVKLLREKAAGGSMRKPPASTWTANSAWATGTKP